MAIMEARGLARAFATKQGRVDAVCGVDFSVEPGEIVGFLGPMAPARRPRCGC